MAKETTAPEPSEETVTETKHRRFITRKEVVTVLPTVRVPAPFQGFVNFVREQGVVGLAVGLVLGAQVKALVDQLVASFVNPLLGLLLPGQGSLSDKAFYLTFKAKTQAFTYGEFLNVMISFFAVAAIVYFAVKGLKLDRLDRKKETAAKS